MRLLHVIVGKLKSFISSSAKFKRLFCVRVYNFSIHTGKNVPFRNMYTHTVYGGIQGNFTTENCEISEKAFLALKDLYI